jgi:hypothetical protein
MRRRADGRNWYRADEAPQKMLGPAGEGIELGFRLQDFLHRMRDDSDLLNQRLRLSGDVRLRQEYEPSVDGWSAVESEVHLARGLAYSGNIDGYVARMIALCDGQRRLGDLVAELAGWIDKNPEEVRAACVEVVRRLVQRGFLLPAAEDQSRGSVTRSG